jgi:VCBS repeat-containing protein
VGQIQVSVVDTDSGNLSATSTFVLTVSQNVNPIPDDQSISVSHDKTFNGQLTATDFQGGTLTFAQGATAAANGTVVINANGSFTYTPNAGYEGPDSFSFTVTDPQNNSSVSDGTVNIAVTNAAPVAADSSLNAAPGVTTNGSVSATDADGDSLTYNLGTNVTGGVLVLNPDGTYSYTPNAGTTSDSFTFTATDGLDVSNVATVTITVAVPNAAPVMNNPAVGNPISNPLSLGTVKATSANSPQFKAITLVNATGANVTDTGGENLGVAITFAKIVGNGHWEYKLDAGNFTAFTASADSAVLLPGRALLRYVPGEATVAGVASLNFRGWSFPSGGPAVGVGTANLTDPDPVAPGNQAAGGNTAFTAGYQRADLTVLAAPKITLGIGAADPAFAGTGINFMYGSGTNRSIVTDADTSDFNGSVLLVSGLKAEDTVGVSGNFSISGTDLKFNGTTIGTVNSSGQGIDLKITLTSSTSTDTMTRLVNALRFTTTASTSTRTLHVTVTDPTGVTSVAQDRTINKA